MTTGSTRAKRRRRDTDRQICLENPVCYAWDVEFDRKTIRLVSLDLFDPDAEGGGEWVDVPPPFGPAATTAALKALKRAATDGEYELGCRDETCECVLSKTWSAWSKWETHDISGGFVVVNPPPGKLNYRANGTVKARARMRLGVCYRIGQPSA